MTPAPPLPSAATGLLQSSSGLNRWLDHLGAEIGTGLMHAHTPGMVHVSAVHSPHMAALAAGATLLSCTGPACVWCLRRRHYLRQSARGLVSVKVWRERWRWHSRTHGKRMKGMPPPKAFAGWPTRSGATLWLRCEGGGNLKVLEECAPELASEMACMDLSFERVYRNQAQVLMHVGRQDSLAETFPWPWLDRATTDFLGPVPAGVDRNGKPVMIDLREHCALVGGTTGAGKSWWVHTVVAAAMLDPRVRVHILDGKWGTGFAVWESAAASFASNDKDEMEEAYKIVRRLEVQVDRIYNEQRANGKRTIDWATAEHVDLLVLDEFTAFYGYKDIAKRLANLIARGRAAGLMMIFTTQRPSSKIVDTDFRELFHYRVAFWSDRNGSKMILGDGVEADSSEFSGLNPGEMYLLTQGRQTVRCRGYSLTDSNLAMLAARATALRSKQDGQMVNDRLNDPETPPAPFHNVAVHGSTGGHSDLPGEAPSFDQEPRKPLEGYQRATLAAVNEHGPHATVKVLAPALGLPDYEIRRRLNRLERLGLVSAARRAHPPGEGEGAREPKLWSVTPDGLAELSDAREEVKV